MTHRILSSYLYPLVLTILVLMASCGRENEPVVPDTPPQGVYVTDTVHYADRGVTAYNITYASTDPYGEPAMLSAAIVLADDIVQSRHALGMLLYNHVSVYRAADCPTRGSIAVEQKMAPSGLITVTADYYGFGATEQMNQAYCMADANAQASIDALLAAKRLLAWKGYTVDEPLFVGGYSQGGQTAMGVVKLVAEHYPDLHITYAFAGAGPYDIASTYRDMVQTDISGQPSTVVSVLLAYNQYCHLDIPYSDLFLEPVLSHIDDWVLSKQYTRPQVDSLMGGMALSQFLAPDLMNLDSELSRRIMAVLESHSLCAGWTPRGDEHLLLFHNMNDITVPPDNTESLYQFLQQHGVEADLYMGDYGTDASGDGHSTGAMLFSIAVINKMAEILGVTPWSIF